MRSFVYDLNGEELEFRLTSSDAIKIEETYKVKLLDFIQDYSIKTMVTLLRYMRKGATGRSQSQEEAEQLFDKLVDSGLALENILTEIIMPACEKSGLLTERDLQMIQEKKEEAKEKATQA